MSNDNEEVLTNILSAYERGEKKMLESEEVMSLNRVALYQIGLKWGLIICLLFLGRLLLYEKDISVALSEGLVIVILMCIIMGLLYYYINGNQNNSSIDVNKLVAENASRLTKYRLL